LIFDQLLELRPNSNEIVPGLAESWKLSADKKSATFQLRAARFSDGSPVTSEDVKFSLERAMNEKIDPAFFEEFTGLIASIGTPNARTVVLDFAGPRPDIFPYLTIETLSVISKKAFERLGPKRFAEDPVGAGSGPFEIVKWTKGRGVELKKNPYYWRSGLPYLNEVHVVHIPEDSSRILAIRSGQSDIADEIPYSQLGALAGAPDIKLAITPLDALDTVFFQAHSGPLSSMSVRQALNYATPTEVIKKIAFDEKGRIANGFIPEVKHWDSHLKPYAYDLAKAKKLLQEAGFGNGFDVGLLVQSGDAVGSQIATILQQAWAKVGVKLHIRLMEEASFESAFGEAHYEALLFPPLSVASDIPSADEYAINYSSSSFGGKEFGVTDPILQRLIKEIEGTWDETKREELFAEFQEEQQRNPIGVPLVFTDARTAVRSNVEGFSYIALNRPYLTETWIQQK
jgi:peptide/nickel transport system substrate-binding protein